MAAVIGLISGISSDFVGRLTVLIVNWALNFFFAVLFYMN